MQRLPATSARLRCRRSASLAATLPRLDSKLRPRRPRRPHDHYSYGQRRWGNARAPAAPGRHAISRRPKESSPHGRPRTHPNRTCANRHRGRSPPDSRGASVAPWSTPRRATTRPVFGRRRALATLRFKDRRPAVHECPSNTAAGATPTLHNCTMVYLRPFPSRARRSCGS